MIMKLSEKDIHIAEIQLEMKSLGYQWQEHQYNDGFDEVYLIISKDRDPSVFDRKAEDAGWGRMGRLTAWKSALEYANNIS